MATTVVIPVLGDMSFVQLVIYRLALLVLFILIRQRYFSVISDIPGPVLGTCFQLWEICRGRFNEKLARLHREHGMIPIVIHRTRC